MIRFLLLPAPGLSPGKGGVVRPPDAPGLLLPPRFVLYLILEFSFSQGYLLCPQVLKARLGCLGISLASVWTLSSSWFSPFNSFQPLMEALSPLVKRTIWGPSKGSLGWPWVFLGRLHGQALLSSASASFSPSGRDPDRWWIGFDALYLVYARWSYIWLFWVLWVIEFPRLALLSWFFLPVKAGRKIPWRSAMIQSSSPFRSSIPVLLLRSFPKGVAVLLAHLYDRKLHKASSVSLDRPLCSHCLSMMRW
jgi:hypothetical protein